MSAFTNSFTRGLVQQGSNLNQPPAILSDGNTVAWYDFKNTASITKNNIDLVSRFNDKLGSGHDLLQADSSRMPVLALDGLLFNGTSDFMQTTPFTYSRPEMMYLLLRQVTWSSDDVLLGGVANDLQLTQRGSSPNININNKTISNNGYMTVGEFKVLRVLLSTTSVTLQVNETAKTSASLATPDMGGITLGANYIHLAYYGNIQVKEAIFRKVADNIDTQNVIYQYLNKKNKLISKWDAKTWNAVGDSITRADRYQPLVSRQFRLTAINEGVSGSTVAKTAVGTQNISMVQRVCGLDGVTAIADANLWTIFGGVNDAASNILVPLGSVADSGFNPATFYGAYQMIIENILARPNSPKLILFTPLHSSRDGALLDSYMTAIKVLGIRYNIPVLDLYNVSGITSANLATYTFDGIHPTQAGTELYFGKIVDAIKGVTP